MPAEPPGGAPIQVFADCSDWLLVIGGTALQGYGMDRMTFDTDCAILDSDEPRLRQVLWPLGYVLDDHKPSFTRYHHLGNRRPVVDAMRLDAATMARLWPDSRKVKVLDWQVRVPAPLHLVAMKLHALKQQPERDYKDWADICYLLEGHRSDWTPAGLQALAERYASEKTAQQLRERGLL